MIFKFIENYIREKSFLLVASQERWENYFRIFFSLFFFCSTSEYIINVLYFRSLDPTDWNLLLFWIPKDNYFFFFTIIAIIHFLAWIMIILKPLWSFSRWLFLLTALLVLMIYNSTESPIHSTVGWLFTAIFLNFVDNKKTNFFRNFFLFKSAQFIILYLYFLIGLWKIRILLTNFFRDHQFDEISNYLVSSIAIRMTQKDVLYESSHWFMNLPTHWHAIGWLTITALQLSVIFFIFKDSYLKVIAMCLIVFHLTTQLVMDISFSPMLFLISVIFFHSPFELRDTRQAQISP